MNRVVKVRQRLGIPDDAKRVLIFSESSHWDPNWLLTSKEYFDRFVRNNLDQAIRELKREPRRVYSIECIFFLRMYWDSFPEQHESIRNLVNEGRLRLTSSGVTTADTILPDSEAVLRDLLIGQEWMRKNGMEQEPKLAYFADSFGCTPNLPSLLKAAGFDRTVITRIDGMYFMGCDLESSKRFPKQGSSAELLLNKERSLDFIWSDRNGARVLCHWNAFTYGQGDMLAYVGLSRVYLARFALPARSNRHIAHRINEYVARLSPYSRTPYMLCPIGFDFVEPIPDLVSLLDRYNQSYYPITGIWAVNAGIDDYLALVEAYKDELPVIELDPNPYWTGFYTSRPTLKKRCRKLVHDLLMAEKLSFLPENDGANKTILSDLKDEWWHAAVSNHHDFITGTSPDRVVETEQIPRLVRAIDSTDAVISRLTSVLHVSGIKKNRLKSVIWSRRKGKIKIENAYYVIELAEDEGGAIVGLQSRDKQTPLITGISNDLVSYRDSGGLWRMGLEFAGGIWKESIRASRHSIQMQVSEHDNGLEIISSTELNGKTICRRMWLSDSPVIRFRVEGCAAQGYSVTVCFETGISVDSLVMDTPGGIVVRPPKRIYNPTFWPLHHFIHFQDTQTGRGLAILGIMPGAVSCKPNGHVELVVMRNATREKVFGFIGIPGNPASGHEREDYAYEYALLFTQNGDWQDNDIHIKAWEMVNSPWEDSKCKAFRRLADTIVTTDNVDVLVTVVKPASRGDGVIVRLFAPVPPKFPVLVKANHLTVARAFMCDARERDIEQLEVHDGNVRLMMEGTVATIRLLPG